SWRFLSPATYEGASSGDLMERVTERWRRWVRDELPGILTELSADRLTAALRAPEVRPGARCRMGIREDDGILRGRGAAETRLPAARVVRACGTCACAPRSPAGRAVRFWGYIEELNRYL